MAEYTVQAPDGKEITIEGPVGASHADVIAQAQKLYRPQAPQQGGNIINSDVPTVVGQQPNPQPVAEPQRTLADYLKAGVQVPAALASGAVAQPIGAAYGVAKSMMSPNYGTQQGVQEGQQAGGELANKLQYQPTNPVAQEAMGNIGSALEATKIAPSPIAIGQIPSFAKQTGAIGQYIKPTIQEAGVVGKAMGENISPVAKNMATALRRTPSITELAPSSEQLAQKSSQLFKTAKESGVELNAKDFANNMASIGKDLRNEGYDPRLYPKLSVALDEMTQAGIPKDFNELKTLRKFVMGAQKSADPEERRLATMLKSDFDEYVANIPESSVVGGNKEGLKAWKDARDTYTKLSKSDIFTEMLDNAQLDKSKFSMSGMENSLAQQLRQLAKNDKKMRLFTEDEQNAIKEAAKGGTGQNILRVIGKFAPTSAVSSIPALLATSVSGPLGLASAAASLGARSAATALRKNDVNKLAALMRASKNLETGE